MKKRKTKALGQHFLKNPLVLRKIVEVISPQENDLIIEIGAGKGALTFPLTKKADKVIAIEKDKEFASLLKAKNIPNLKILEEDILKVELNKVIKRESEPKGKTKIVGNLPYSISTPILFKILKEKELFSECTLMLQKEVAERICVQPGSKKYAPLSLYFQNYFSTEMCFGVGPKSFSPPPQIQSALIFLKKRKKPLFQTHREKDFHLFLKGAFQRRRRTLFNNLIKLKFSKLAVEDAFQALSLDRMIRAEQLPLSQFVKLFKLLVQNQEITKK